MRDRAAADLVLTPALPPVAQVTLANRQALARACATAALQQIDRLRALLKESPRSTLSMRTGPPPPLCRALDPLNHASISP